MKKTFEVHNPDNQEVKTKKTFQIQPAHKTFIVEGQTETRRRDEWFRQTNDSDCGPCLLLNTLKRLGVENLPVGIEEMRREINRQRRERSQIELAENDWLTTLDINDFLRSKGFVVRTFASGSNDPEAVIREAQNDIENEPFDFVYTSFPASHYRGIIPADEPRNFLLLDSLQNGPQVFSEEQFNAIVKNTLGRSPRGGRYENLVIVRGHRD